mmetsp:Transcript_64876/g.169850  ORF Transcript_64876/g.169850 Transcript_64876/m.169850 type:complete len:276 (+) Transcript_64876:227-1054(+)
MIHTQPYEHGRGLGIRWPSGSCHVPMQCRQPGQPAVWNLRKESSGMKPSDGEEVVAVRANADRADRHSNELLNAHDVALRRLGQLREPSALGDVLAPPLEGLVLADHLLEVVQVRGEVARGQADLAHVGVPVGHGHPDLLEARQDVELRDADAVVAVDHRGVLHQRDVQPAAASPAPRRGAVLVADLLEQLADLDLLALPQHKVAGGVALPHARYVLADVVPDEILHRLVLVLQLGREGAEAHARGVCLHDADDAIDHLGRHSEPRTHAANCRVR